MLNLPEPCVLSLEDILKNKPLYYEICIVITKITHTHEGGAHLKISFMHLLLNLKNKELFKKTVEGGQWKQNYDVRFLKNGVWWTDRQTEGWMEKVTYIGGCPAHRKRIYFISISFFLKKGLKISPLSSHYSIPFLSVLHQNKALHNFRTRGQRW